MAMAIWWIWAQVKRQFSHKIGNLQDDYELVSVSFPLEARRSVASTVEWKYDVFLSFRGADTRMNITYELYDGLQNKAGIKTFMADHDLEVGDPISPTLVKAIEQSRFAIIVLSPNYAVSTWCLEELAKICECMNDDHNRILPLFYNVEPTDVRYQKRSFKEAFNKHEGSARHAAEKVQLWRDVLETVANFSGWNAKDFKKDRELVESIVDFMCTKVHSSETNLTLTTCGDFQSFKATRKAMNDVMKALQDKEVTALGVYGMGGVGKTTLVKHVGAEAHKKRMFDYVIVVVVSQSPQVNQIQQSFAEQLSFNFQENSTERGRALRLYKEIMRKNNILIILDDIWNYIDLSTLGIPLHELKKCNSKVLLTSRRLHVCNVMRTQVSIPLSILSKEDSWTLFVSKARRSFESTEFNDIARKVTGECKGLPIALIAVARALGDKDLEEWKKAVQRLQKSQPATLDDEGDAYQCIQLSYDYLRDEDSKACFLLCCLFPEDSSIKLTDLFRYAIGIGLFRDCETIYEARGIAVSVVKYLKDSSLLFEDDTYDHEGDTCLRMHDVIRDTAMNIAKSVGGHAFLGKAGIGLKQWPRLLSEGYTAVSFIGNDLRELPPRLVCPKLQILLLNKNECLELIPETFLESLNELRVLDLSQTDISLLPQSLGRSTNLQALHLNKLRHLTDISMVGKLTELQILSMHYIKLEELPREIGDLRNLRVLDITGGHIARIPSKLISRLHNLEELYIPEYELCDRESKVVGEGDEASASFDEVTSLSKLRVLVAWISNAECIPKYVELNLNWDDFYICIGEEKRSYSSTGYHTAKGLAISNLPDWFVSIVRNKVEYLKWRDCPRLTEIFVEHENGRLHGLRRLTVNGVAARDYKNSATWVPEIPLLKSLELLKLWSVDCQGFSVTELAPGSLFSLMRLEVQDCYNWGNVFLPSTLLQRLENLQVVRCCQVEEIKYLFQYNATPELQQSQFEPQQSQLRHIYCFQLNAIESLCDGPAPPALFQNLQYLSIERCCNLNGSLFTSDVAQCLFQLKELDLQDCPNLERIIEATDKRIIHLKLATLILIQLPMLYHESSTLNIECPSLQDLCVEGCQKFAVSVPDFRSRNKVRVHETMASFYLYRNRSSSDEGDESGEKGEY